MERRYLKLAVTRYAVEDSLFRARRRAHEHGIPFDLTTTYIEEMMLAQGHKCAVSGLHFHLSRAGKRAQKVRLPFRPSIDRLEPSLGYVQGNVRLVCFAVNMAIADWGDDVFIEICRAVAKRPGSRVTTRRGISTVGVQAAA